MTTTPLDIAPSRQITLTAQNISKTVAIILTIALTTTISKIPHAEAQIEHSNTVDIQNNLPERDYVPNRSETNLSTKIEKLDSTSPAVSSYYRQKPPLDPGNQQIPPAKNQYVPGEMRSDRIAIPSGFTKAEADSAEIQEARLQILRASSTDCKVFWPSPNRVCGAILERYENIGGPVSWLGLPRSEELTNPDRTGKRTEFLGGNIYWHPKFGAHSVAPDSSKVWENTGYERGILGYPVEEAFTTRMKFTFGQRFSGGDIYYSPLTGGSVVGDIRERYNRLGGSNHPIGVPISGELSNEEQFRFVNFSNGTLSWRAKDRATRFMFFNTQKIWEATGRETGIYGFPSQDELATIPGLFHEVRFDNRGIILWSKSFGARELNGQVFAYWKSLANTSDNLGYPLADSTSFRESSIQRFSKATIFGSGTDLAVIHREAPLVENNNFLTTRDDSIINGSTMARANLSAGTRVSNSAPGVIRGKLDFPDVRFVVRKGFYARYANGNDDGWGSDKLIQKHNLSNYNLLFNLINDAPRNTSLSTSPDNYAYTHEVYFVKCGGFNLSGSAKCEEAKPMQWVTTVYRPVVNNTYKGYESKDPKIEGDNWPVGVVTGFCHERKSDANGQGDSASKCPDYVNLYDKLS